uniref:Autophagy-related protein 23 n=3 Tax=Anthurium amnicola TaxID=1678845 RepID=A0A1D1YSQ5_9ARAE
MASTPPGFGLPEEVLAVLPADPFEQLDVARKITSIALAARVSKLEAEASRLRRELAERDDDVAELRAQVETLDASLGDISRQLARADEEKEALRGENASLAATVKKLNRDVSKLEIFKKTLMQSLQEDEENSHAGSTKVVPSLVSQSSSFGSLRGEMDATQSSLKMSSVQSQLSETGSSISDDTGLVESDASKHGASHGLLLASQSSTARLTPPDSPTRHSAAGSPKRLSKPGSPRRHSISLSNARNIFDERSSISSSMPSGHHNSMSSPFDAGTHAGRARVDGKEFFRQVRTRLSYEQFSAFLTNVKELNSHKQTREETLRKADEIFGADNRDLYAIFEGLISRNLH